MQADGPMVSVTAAVLGAGALTAAFGLIEPIFIGNRFQNKWEIKK
jgi:hypothetical protein